jgi:hypothetical protein
MKVEVQDMKKFAVENTEVMNAKSSQDKRKVVAQINNNEETSREERKGDSAKLSKTWAQVTSNSAKRKEKQTFRWTTCKIEKARKDMKEQQE